jgi:hypothetical protein
MLDSGAGVATCRLGWILPIIERFPSCVKLLIDCKDGQYQPLVLAGVVADDSSVPKMTSELGVYVEFYTPYRKHAGTFLTLGFGCSPNLSVNAILGISFMKEVQMTLDPANMKAYTPALEVKQFDIIDLPPSSDDPRIPSSSNPSCLVGDVSSETRTALTDQVISAVAHLRNRYLRPVPPSVPPPVNHSVAFSQPPHYINGDGIYQGPSEEQG